MRSSMLVLILLMAGCASNPPADVGPVRTSWNGATYDEVVTKWGTPVRSTRMSDGRDVYTWVSESVGPARGGPAFFPSLGLFGGSGGFGLGTGVTFGGGAAAGSEMYRCERTLIFREGRVNEQTWQGPPEYCASFGR